MTDAPKKRGRPASGKAKSDADRAALHRSRAVDRQLLTNEQCTNRQLLMRLADLHKSEAGNYYLIRLALEELTRRNELNRPDLT